MCCAVENILYMVVAPVMPLERRCQYKCFAFVYPYASVKNMGSAATVLFFLGGGGGVAPMLKLDRRQGSVTNTKTSVRGGSYCSPLKYLQNNILPRITSPGAATRRPAPEVTRTIASKPWLKSTLGHALKTKNKIASTWRQEWPLVQNRAVLGCLLPFRHFAEPRTKHEQLGPVSM